jgi:hypothetical protein
MYTIVTKFYVFVLQFDARLHTKTPREHFEAFLFTC